MWETLANQADETKQRGGPINLRRQLQSEVYNGRGLISEYISRILSYRDRLAHTPQKLSKDEVIAHILIGLPKTWNTISTIIENQPPETQTLDDVVNTLNSHERKQTTLKQSEQSNAFLGRRQARVGNALKPYQNRRFKGRVNKSFRDRDQDQDQDQDDDSDNELECWYCAKRGHTSRHCQIKRLAMKRHKERERHDTANLATANISDAIVL